MPLRSHRLAAPLWLAAAMALAAPAQAALVDVTVTFQSLARPNGVSFAPLRFGFNGGTFDAFNTAQSATAPIISIAEGGGGADWFPAFAAADPTAVIGSASAAPVVPGMTVTSATFRVDTSVNPFFTFAAMVVPSNDFFIGNDSPTGYRLFDGAGNLLIGAIDQDARDIWNAGSEAFDPLNAAFLQIGNNDLRTPENGVVGFNFAELAGFNGLTTAANYVFESGLDADTPIGRITFAATVVPEPGGWAAFASGVIVLGLVARRRLGPPRTPAA